MLQTGNALVTFYSSLNVNGSTLTYVIEAGQLFLQGNGVIGSLYIMGSGIQFYVEGNWNVTNTFYCSGETNSAAGSGYVR